MKLFKGLGKKRATKTVVEQVGGGNMYIGTALSGTMDDEPFWQIMRIHSDDTTTQVLYAEGDEDSAYKWAKRAEYTYK